jgi:Zn-dependent M28 family amino/carboxypeptidase
VERLQSTPSQATALTTSLCDTAGPRLSGSSGDARAVAWAVETMQRLGLAHVHTEPVTVPRWVRGEEEAHVVAPLYQPLAVAALGSSPSTPDGGIEADLVEVTSLEQLEALAPHSLAGKILFANLPMARTNDGASYAATVPVRRLASVQAALAQAEGVVIRSVGTDHNRLAHTGAQGDHPVPAAAVSVPDAELLHRLLGRGPVRLALRLVTREEPPVQSANVVGEVLGREHPEEIVLLGAHLDSWDLGTGAVDDGAGVGLVLDVARALKELARPPRRTVRIVLYANEENGLAGARAYAEAHGAELAHHVVALEADSGSDRAVGVRVLGGPGAREALRERQRWFQALDVEVREDDAHGGADTGVLRTAGVPQLDLRQDVSRYFDLHHTANDTVDKIDAAQHAQAAHALATLVWFAAEEAVDFGRLMPEQQDTPRREGQAGGPR